MSSFRACVDRRACTEDGSHCRSCGRSHAEIDHVRQLTSEVAGFLQDMQ